MLTHLEDWADALALTGVLCSGNTVQCLFTPSWTALYKCDVSQWGAVYTNACFLWYVFLQHSSESASNFHHSSLPSLHQRSETSLLPLASHWRVSLYKPSERFQRMTISQWVSQEEHVVSLLVCLIRDNDTHLCKSQQCASSLEVWLISSPTHSFQICLKRWHWSKIWKRVVLLLVVYSPTSPSYWSSFLSSFPWALHQVVHSRTEIIWQLCSVGSVFWGKFRGLGW